MPDVSALYNAATGERAALASAALVVLFLIGAAAFRRLHPWTSQLRGKAILTPNELHFFRLLLRAMPQHHIFTQVSLSALIALDPQLSKKKQFAIRRRYGWKYADFVICYPDTLGVLAIVELDDVTHTASDDRKRDAITRAAGYQTLRYQSKQKPSVSELADTLTKIAATQREKYHA